MREWRARLFNKMTNGTYTPTESQVVKAPLLWYKQQLSQLTQNGFGSPFIAQKSFSEIAQLVEMRNQNIREWNASENAVGGPVNVLPNLTGQDITHKTPPVTGAGKKFSKSSKHNSPPERSYYRPQQQSRHHRSQPEAAKLRQTSSSSKRLHQHRSPLTRPSSSRPKKHKSYSITNLDNWCASILKSKYDKMR